MTNIYCTFYIVWDMRWQYTVEILYNLLVLLQSINMYQSGMKVNDVLTYHGVNTCSVNVLLQKCQWVHVHAEHQT